jgi:hypothetical protein
LGENRVMGDHLGNIPAAKGAFNLSLTNA